MRVLEYNGICYNIYKPSKRQSWWQQTTILLFVLIIFQRKQVLIFHVTWNVRTYFLWKYSQTARMHWFIWLATENATNNLIGPENATIMKHSPPEAPKEGEIKNEQWQNKSTYETIETQTERNCNRAIEWSVEKLLWGRICFVFCF